MRQYHVVLSENAESDLQNYIDYITHACKAPLTALRHYESLFETLKSLKHSPESYSIQTRKSLQQFGANIRRVNFKKMAIIYSIHGDIVYIHRIVAGSLIIEL